MRSIGLITLGVGGTLCAIKSPDKQASTSARAAGPALAALGVVAYFFGESFLSVQDRLLADKGFILPSLERSITLSNCPKLTNTMFERLQAFANLQELVIENCGGLTDRAIETLQKLPYLERVVIRDCGGLTDLSLYHLSKIPTLSELQLVGLPGFKGEGLMCVGEMVRLQTLVLQSLPLTDVGLGQLEIPPSLRTLTLSHLKEIEGSGFSSLRNTSLKQLYIVDCPNLNEKGWNAFRKIDATTFDQVVIWRCGAFDQLVFPASNFAGKLVVESAAPVLQPAG